MRNRRASSHNRLLCPLAFGKKGKNSTFLFPYQKTFTAIPDPGEDSHDNTALIFLGRHKTRLSLLLIDAWNCTCFPSEQIIIVLLSDVLFMAFVYLPVYTGLEKYVHRRPALWPVHCFKLSFSMCGIFWNFSYSGTNVANETYCSCKVGHLKRGPLKRITNSFSLITARLLTNSLQISHFTSNTAQCTTDKLIFSTMEGINEGANLK